MHKQPIRVAICQRVCSHYRVPIYRKLASMEDIQLKVFHGDDLVGTKFVNAGATDGFERQKLLSWHLTARSSGRRVPVMFTPTLAWALWKYRPDVIVTGGGGNFLNNFAIFAYARMFRVPVVWWTLGMLAGRTYSGTGRLYRAMIRKFEQAADALLGYSSAALDYFRQMGYQEDKCFRAVNSLDADKIAADIIRVQPVVAEVRDRLKLHGKDVVLFVGAFEQGKTIHRLLHAFPHIRERNPNAHMLLVGDGPMRPHLEQLACELGLENHATFTGRVVGDVAAYFQQASVFVLPGLGGLAMVEALAHGIPVVCGRGDGTERDYVVHGVTGFRFDASDDTTAVESIVRYSCELLENPPLRQHMAASARNLIADKYNGNTYVQSIYEAIKYTLVGQRAA